MFSVWPDGDTKQKRDKCGGVVDGSSTKLLMESLTRRCSGAQGLPSGLGLAEGGRGLCRAQPVTPRLVLVQRRENSWFCTLVLVLMDAM